MPGASWWRELSGPARFRLYARLTLQGAVGVIAVALANVDHTPWSLAGIAVSAVAGVVAVSAQPDLGTRTATAFWRWVLPTVVVTLALVWLIYVVVARRASDAGDVDAARMAAIGAVLIAGMVIVPFVPHKWPIALAISVACGLAFGTTPAAGFRAAVLMMAVIGFVLATTLVTVWSVQVVDELDRAKLVEGRLQVAEERLRFSRDLHDVVGRGFSAIAVKSELAAALARANASDRAAAEMDEVKNLAVQSMDQMRELVRGYRDINLESEVAGARSLLEAAGCRLAIEGDAANVPSRFHETAAWVVREGTTNIVKHSSATVATLSLGAVGMALRNNGSSVAATGPHDAGEHSGLRGLTERLAQVGATLDTAGSGDDFVLEIQWEKQ